MGVYMIYPHCDGLGTGDLGCGLGDGVSEGLPLPVVFLVGLVGADAAPLPNCLDLCLAGGMSPSKGETDSSTLPSLDVSSITETSLP